MINYLIWILFSSPLGCLWKRERTHTYNTYMLLIIYYRGLLCCGSRGPDTFLPRIHFTRQRGRLISVVWPPLRDKSRDLFSGYAFHNSTRLDTRALSNAHCFLYFSCAQGRSRKKRLIHNSLWSYQTPIPFVSTIRVRQGGISEHWFSSVTPSPVNRPDRTRQTQAVNSWRGDSERIRRGVESFPRLFVSGRGMITFGGDF